MSAAPRDPYSDARRGAAENRLCPECDDPLPCACMDAAEVEGGFEPSLPAHRKAVWVFSGPFGGKTTLLKALRAARPDLLVGETDEIRKALPGWKPQYWRAWRKNHPDHATWLRFDAELQKQTTELLERGAVVLFHDLPYAEQAHLVGLTLFICPPYEELFLRMAAYAEWGTTPAGIKHELAKERSPFRNQRLLLGARPEIIYGSRLGAAAHYWTKPEILKLRQAADGDGIVRVASADEALSLILQYISR